jgi:hypothetical protein
MHVRETCKFMNASMMLLESVDPPKCWDIHKTGEFMGESWGYENVLSYVALRICESMDVSTKLCVFVFDQKKVFPAKLCKGSIFCLTRGDFRNRGGDFRNRGDLREFPYFQRSRGDLGRLTTTTRKSHGLLYDFY